jgi:hypothetical protein
MRSFTHSGERNQTLRSATTLSLRCVGIKRLAFDVNESLSRT